MVHTYRFNMYISVGTESSVSASDEELESTEVLLSYNSEPLQENEDLSQVACYLLTHIFMFRDFSTSSREDISVSLPVFVHFLNSFGEHLYATWVEHHNRLSVHILNVNPTSKCIWILFN